MILHATGGKSNFHGINSLHTAKSPNLSMEKREKKEEKNLRVSFMNGIKKILRNWGEATAYFYERNFLAGKIKLTLSKTCSRLLQMSTKNGLTLSLFPSPSTFGTRKKNGALLLKTKQDFCSYRFEAQNTTDAIGCELSVFYERAANIFRVKLPCGGVVALTERISSGIHLPSTYEICTLKKKQFVGWDRIDS